MHNLFQLTDERDAAESTWNHIASLSGSDFDLAAHGDQQNIRDLTKHVVTDRPDTDAPDPAHVWLLETVACLWEITP